MSAGIKTIFICSNCDAQFPKWSGRCLECGSWGTLNSGVTDAKSEKKEAAKKLGGATVLDFNSIPDTALARQRTGSEEIDRVLGGGLVPGSLILLSGEPGIGKSTLAAQIAGGLGNKIMTIYVSGEESAGQVKSRLQRLNTDFSQLKFVSETNAEKICSTALKLKPDIVIIDSIQTVYSALIPAEAGSVSQIRAAAVKFLELSKENNIAVILIGHITKDGQVAGPKSLEHIVDTVLYLENENTNNYCLLRATKNRFGSVNELGVLEMTGTGFKEVKNPSRIFLDSSSANISGSAIGCVLEGTRPFMVDLQALVTKTVFGYPQRKASGFDLNRLQVLSSVITKRTKINLTTQDIILNVVGGLRISDPALDLAACAAIISSSLNKTWGRRTVALGEVGLGAEVRNVFKLEMRLKEAERLGFEAAVIPDVEVKGSKLRLMKIKNLDELAEIIK
ncbi:DNA repair protein RadA [Candidatus Falkowbacteria bacterium CG10_big_fil_rev_8_21_14_0_10_37_18]|uniref:DNA repair protein RadA n=1 Tax=Candidatus Falkowbacteria bacterium CG10_big_fil_rev_8_21_14_0_10_37_18 TaxID=1974562 RepID=A0A2H0V8D6_9BACT|nr:DNA repair protein RadA [Candidatus Falkowbacteria bacterium]PIR95374.1 MAG: DNA repair protein RadA [Candidatus Falkowbacteria bacterium CG10_big_fil_rev_8_21_14_0_10_37_18]